MLIGSFNRALEGKPKRKKNITGNIRYQPARETAKRMCGYSPEVMVRITSYGKNAGNALANLGYISRTDANAERNNKEELELETDRGEILSGKEAIREYAQGWEQDFGKPNKRRRDTLRMILSMPEGTNPEGVKNATRDFARQTFGANHEYVFVLHTDEPHPHCHLTVKMLGHDGTRLDPGREDLANWREAFAQALRDHDVDAIATRRAARGVVRKAEKSVVQHIADSPRKGKQRVPKVVAMREVDAIAELTAEQQGRPLPTHPWEPAIRAEQQAVRSAWLAVADQLERGPAQLVFLPADSALQRTQASAASYQAGLNGRRAIDPRKAPPLSSIGTAAGIPTLAQVGTVGTGKRHTAAPNPVALFPEDHHERIKHGQQHGAAYQVRLAAPRAGEPPRQVADIAALPRIKLTGHGMPLQWRRPLTTASVASMPTLASLNRPRSGAGPVRIPPPLVFTQEILHERPNWNQQAAAVYQSRLATPRRPPPRSAPSVRELPRLDVVRRGGSAGRTAQVLLQQDARYLMGQLAGADPSLRRPGAGPAGDHRSGTREGGTQGREGGTQGRGGAARGGAGGAQEGSRGAQGRAGRREEGRQDRPESARERSRGSGAGFASIPSYRSIGTAASILKLSDVAGTAGDDKALASQIRAFVAAMPAVESTRDVLKRELAARFPAKAAEHIPTQQQVEKKGQQQGQKEGADQAAPKGKDLGL